MVDKVRRIFPVSEDDVKEAREIFGKSDRDVEKDVEELAEWMEQQPHLPKNPDKVRLERFLLRNKFRVDQTKQKLDAYYTMRGEYNDFLKNIDPGCDAMVNVRKSLYWSSLPVLTPKKERVTVMKYLDKTADFFNLESLAVHVCTLIDIQLSHDYAVGEHFLVDMSEFGFKHLKAYGLRSLYRTIRLYQNCFSGRMTGCQIINPPSFIKVFMALVELAAPAKFFEKIKVHQDMETVYERIPKSCLPREYGGDLDVSVSYIHDRTSEMLMSMRDFVLDNSRKVADESLRPKS